jgi:hypothetical protein
MKLSLLVNIVFLILFFIFKKTQVNDNIFPVLILLLTLVMYDIYMYLGIKKIKNL